MLKFRLFEIDDIKELAKNAIDKSITNVDDETLLKYARYHKDNGSAFTGLLNDRVVCAAGIHNRRANSGHLWSIFTKSAMIHKKTVFKSLKLMLDAVIKSNELKKIITESRKSFAESQRLIEHLGFEKQRHSFNDDYYFYKKVI
jgi:hypothetical protein